MLEGINIGVAIQDQSHKIKIKSDTIVTAKVSKIADQKVRQDRQIKVEQKIKDDQQVEEEKDVEEEQKKKDVHVSQNLLDNIENDINTIHNVSLRFSVHDESGRTMIKVIEKSTGNLIRQIPPEEMLELVSRIDKVLGMLFDERA